MRPSSCSLPLHASSQVPHPLNPQASDALFRQINHALHTWLPEPSSYSLLLHPDTVWHTALKLAPNMFFQKRSFWDGNKFPLLCCCKNSEVLDLLLKSRIAAIDIVGPLSVYAVWYAFSITGNILFYCRMSMLSEQFYNEKHWKPISTKNFSLSLLGIMNHGLLIERFFW